MAADQRSEVELFIGSLLKSRRSLWRDPNTGINQFVFGYNQPSHGKAD